MSDIRTKLLLGTTISAVSLMLVMAIGISSVNSGTTAGTALAIMGHFEIMVENPDGTTSYVQSDNFINGAAKTNVGTALFTGVTLLQPNVCIILGTGAPTDASDGIVAEIATTGVECAGSASPGGGSVNCNSAGDSVLTTAEQCVVITKHITANDCAPCDISEAALGVGVEDAAALVSTFAYTALTGTITANEGATVTTTYKVAIAGDLV